MQLDSIKLILAECERQNYKFGEQNHHPEKWAVILGEEYGEVCRAILDAGFAQGEIGGLQDYRLQLQKYRDELVQVAAVAISALESLERNEMKEENMPPDIFGGLKDSGKIIQKGMGGETPKIDIEQAILQGLIDSSYTGKVVNGFVAGIIQQKEDIIKEKLQEHNLLHLLDERNENGMYKDLVVLREDGKEHWVAFYQKPHEVRIVTFISGNKNLDFMNGAKLSMEIEYY